MKTETLHIRRDCALTWESDFLLLFDVGASSEKDLPLTAKVVF